jgi:hypothetical protein
VPIKRTKFMSTNSLRSRGASGAGVESVARSRGTSMSSFNPTSW